MENLEINTISKFMTKRNKKKRTVEVKSETAISFKQIFNIFIHHANIQIIV